MPTVSGTVTDRSGNVAAWSASWTVQSISALKVIGMSAPASLWDQRLTEVGPQGVRARRIFADLTSTGRDQSTLISQAITAGMVPVISYKEPLVGGSRDIAGVIAGTYDSWLTAVGSYLAGLNTTVVAVFHHEPRGDMTATQFRQASRRFLDRVKSANVKVGPLLNGFLLDTTNGRTEFATYTDTTLMADWDFMGIDSYQPAAGDPTYPGHRIAPLVNFVNSQGRTGMPLVVGEYNGFDAAAISQSGEIFLSTPTLWIASMWNSGPGGLGTPLQPGTDRMAAFQATKADPRAMQ